MLFGGLFRIENKESRPVRENNSVELIREQIYVGRPLGRYLGKFHPLTFELAIFLRKNSGEHCIVEKISCQHDKVDFEEGGGEKEKKKIR